MDNIWMAKDVENEQSSSLARNDSGITSSEYRDDPNKFDTQWQ